MESEKTYPMSRVDPADTRMELACVCAKTILLYLEDKHGPDTVRELVSQTGMNLEYLQNHTNWISVAYFYRLLDKLVEFTGNPRAPYEAGTYAGRKESFGALALLFARSITIAAAYRFSVWLSPMWDKSSKWKLIESGAQSCTISLEKHPHPQSKNNCLCIQGCLTAGPRLKGLEPARIEELECACDGAPACVYRITWRDRPVQFWGFIGFLTGLVLGGAVYCLGGWQPNVYSLSLLLAVLGFFVGRVIDSTVKIREVYRQNEEQAQSLLETLKTTETLNQELQSKVERRTEELKAANEEQRQTLIQLRESQQKMLAAERQATVGILAAGTAHELNSPINAIKLTLQAMAEESEGNTSMTPLLGTARHASNRCKRIVNDLLSFARDPQQSADTRIETIVTAVVDLFEREHAKSLRVTRDIAPGLPTVNLDKMQLQQAILNILANAADAVKDTGHIHVALTAGAGGVILSIADDGPGMDESVRKRVFEPFFSTKREKGRGLGLGLSIAAQLVYRNEGEIDVTSSPGKGSAFTMRFPAHQNRRSPPSDAIPPPRGPSESLRA